MEEYDENIYAVNTEQNQRRDKTGNKRSNILYKMAKQKSV